MNNPSDDDVDGAKMLDGLVDLALKRAGVPGGPLVSSAPFPNRVVGALAASEEDTDLKRPPDGAEAKGPPLLEKRPAPSALVDLKRFDSVGALNRPGVSEPRINP